MKSKATVLAVFLLLSSLTVWGQCDELSSGCTGTYVQHLEQGAVMNHIFDQTYYPSTTAATWSFCEGIGCTTFTSSITFGGVTLSELNFRQAQLSGSATGDGKYWVTMRISDGGTLSEQRDYIFIIRDPLRLVFILDISGSMDDAAPSSGGASKWSVAEDGIEHFATSTDLLLNQNDSLLVDDRLSLIAFNEDRVIPPVVTGGQIGNFNSVVDFRGMREHVFDEATFVPNGWTSIADGIIHANGATLHSAGGNPDLLRDDLREVNIIISDGMQNRPAEIETAGKKTIGTATNLLNSYSPTDDYIDTYTIGFMNSGSPGIHDDLLEAIASSPTGTTDNYFPTLSSGNIVTVFTEVFQRAFRTFSPQVVDVSAVPPQLDSLQRLVFSRDFQINDDVSGLLFQVNFPENVTNWFHYELYQHGELLPFDLYNTDRGNNSTLLSLSVQNTPNLNSEGVWTVRAIAVEGPPDLGGGIVTMSATVDEHNLDAEFQVLNDPTITAVGQAQVNTRLRPEAQLSLYGEMLEGATVTARLLEPGADKGTLIARANIDYFADSLIDPYTAKFNALLSQDPGTLIPLYELAENEILLTDQGNGRYTGRFGQLDVADNVSVIFRVIYQDSLLGTIRRYYRIGVPVRFGELDQDLSAISVAGGGDNFYTLRYRPTYWNGSRTQLVGPGFASAFRVQDGQLEGVEDLGDGTYEIRVTESAPGRTTNLFLLDEPVYNGPLKDFTKLSQPFEASLHLGYAFPVADAGLFDSLGNGGFLVEVNLAYQFTRQWSVELIGGYYDYQPNDYLLGAGLHARYRWPNPGARVNWTAAAGVGYYARDTGDGFVGLGVRVGAGYHLTKSVLLTGEFGGYFFDEVSNMGLFALGAKYRF
ncbi:MAG: hypothetical protein AAFP77_23775 [Bacteroidota bacterium]